MKTPQSMFNRRHALLLARARFFAPGGAHMPRQVARPLADQLACHSTRHPVGHLARQIISHLIRHFTRALVERMAGQIDGYRTRHGPAAWQVRWCVNPPLSIQFSNRQPPNSLPVP